MTDTRPLPDELYYLDPVPAKMMTKVQLKLVLARHNIEHDRKGSREELMALFQREIASNSEEIIRQYYENKRLESEATAQQQQQQLGRGKRTSTKPSRYENEVEVTKRASKTAAAAKRKTNTRSAAKKDKQGFAIPETPVKKPAVFTAEDSFDEEESNQVDDEDNHSDTSDRTPEETKLPAPVNNTKKGEPRKQTQQHQPPSFNAEDSFASTDDYEYKKPSRTRVLKTRHTITTKKTEVSNLDTQEAIEAINKEIEQAEKVEKPVVDDADLDYQADSDETEDEGEEEVELLRGDEDVPVEKLTNSHSTSVNSRRTFNILNSNILVYAASVVVLAIIYMCSTQES